LGVCFHDWEVHDTSMTSCIFKCSKCDQLYMYDDNDSVL